MWHALQTRRLDKTFDGAPGGPHAVALRAHLADCPTCQRRYQRHLVAEAALPGGEALATDRLWREIEAVAGVAAAAPVRRRWVLPLALAVGAAAAALLLVPRPPDPVARGGAPPALAPALHVFRASGGTAEPVAGSISPGDSLLFAYSNPGPAYTHLMVFALDEQKRVYWYYPAYLQAGDDPRAVPIETGRSGVELREAIRQPLPPGPVRLYALFLPRAERVLDVEAAVAAAHAGHPMSQERPLGVQGSRQESHLLEVKP